MRLTLFIFLLGLVQVTAKSSYSQQTRISMDLKNVQVVDVLSAIENQTDFYFLYNQDLIDVTRKVDVAVVNKQVDEVLAKMFDQTDVSFVINNRQIILTNLGKSSNVQQQKAVSGNITDASGAPLPGVTVVVKGTTTGTITDFDGNFSLSNVPVDASLVFSFVGMKTQEVSVVGKTTINVILEEEAIGVDEVVVVGYGTVKKANLTGAVSSVDFTELETRPASNTATLLQGQMSGVTVSNFNNQPGNDNPEIRIRGVGTLNSGSDPLVIVDGIESDISQIPAADIQSVSVLKDAASASIYGVRAANGVILVTTKRGKSAKPTVNVKQSFAIQQALVKPEFVDSWDYAFLQNLDLTEQGQDPLYTEEHIRLMKDGSQPDLWANTDWFDEMYRNAPMSTTYLSVSGAADNVRYMVSMEYLNQEGTMIETNQERYNFRSNIDVDVTDHIKIGMNVSGNKQDISETLNNASASNNDNDLNYSIRRFANPTVPVKYSNGEWGQVNGLYYEPGSTVGSIRNVVQMASLGENITERYNFQGKVFAEIELVKNLSYRPSFSYVYNSSLRSRFSPTNKTYDANGNVLGESVHNTLMNNNTTWKRYQMENLLSYDYAVDDHSFGFLLGQSAQSFRTDYFYAYVEDFPNNNIHELDGGINNKDVAGNASELALDSYFGRLNYNYMDKYMLEFNYRYDGTSRFHSDNRWGGFPSFSAGWVATNEDFFQDMGPISFLKVRGSWGELGNQNIGGTYYPYTQNINTGQNYLWGDYVAAGVAVTDLANRDLTWETTTITDIGVDLNLFRNKVQIVADWFDKTSSDILIRLPIPSTMGGVSAPFQNVGEVKNTGWELDVKFQDTFGKVGLFGGFNLSGVKNEVIDYGGIESSISNNAITIEGEAIGSYYAYVAEGYYQTQAELDEAPEQFGQALRLGDVKYKDISGPEGVPDGKISSDYDRQIIGTPFPKLQYSFNLGANYKGFDVYAFFQGISGIKRYYWYNTETQGTFTQVAMDYWTEENRNAPTPRWGNLGNNTVYSSFWLKDASYLRLKNLEVGYTLPVILTSKINVTKARIYFSGVNLLTFTDVPDYDPEKLTNDDRNRDYPQAKVYSVGINVTF